MSTIDSSATSAKTPGDLLKLPWVAEMQEEVIFHLGQETPTIRKVARRFIEAVASMKVNDLIDLAALLCVKAPTQYLILNGLERSTELVAVAAPTDPLGVVVVHELAQDIWAHIESAPRGAMHLMAASLTLPKWRRPEEFRPIAQEFANTFSGGGEGALMVFDVASDGRLHFYSFLLTPKSGHEVRSTWCSFTGALIVAARAVRVTGEGGPWRAEQNARFDENLRRALNYAFKALPPEFAEQWALADRVIVAGEFIALWRAASERLGVAPRVVVSASKKASTRSQEASTPVPSDSSTIDGRRCARCGKSMIGKRSHAIWCSRSCRTLNCREQAWKKSLQNKLSIASDPLPTISQPATGAATPVNGAPVPQLTASLAALTLVETSVAAQSQPGVPELPPEEVHLSTVSQVNRKAIRAGLRTISKILKYADERACPWASLTEKQVKRVVRELWLEYSPNTIAIYVGALRHVLDIAGRGALAQYAHAIQKKRAHKFKKYWASDEGREAEAKAIADHERRMSLPWDPATGLSLTEEFSLN